MAIEVEIGPGYMSVDTDLGSAPAAFERAVGGPVVSVDPTIATRQEAWLRECEVKYTSGGSRTHAPEYVDPLSRLSTGPSDNLSL